MRNQSHLNGPPKEAGTAGLSPGGTLRELKRSCGEFRGVSPNGNPEAKEGGKRDT